MKKFINRAEDAVEEMLQGLAALNPGIARLNGHKVLLRADAENLRDQQVALISGGGSGHEPAHAGYIGSHMLSAAVLGEIFTSPSSDSIFAAIKAVTGKPGALLIVKSYMGDRLNFGLAAEMARAEGIAVELLVVDDDVALKGLPIPTRARGLAGTVFIHKLLGAAASEGRSLGDLKALGEKAVSSLATMGISLSAGTAPAVGKPSFELGENEVELGLGIHGEPGVLRTELLSADDLTERLVTQILNNVDVHSHRHVAVMVNNLGATTDMELAIVARSVLRLLRGNRFTVERIYVGKFLTSLDMAGISISMLDVRDEWLHWLDAETTAPAWPHVLKQRPSQLPATITSEARTEVTPSLYSDAHSEAAPKLKRSIQSVCAALINAEGELTELDRVTGDGDMGVNMARAARVVQGSLDTYPLNSLPATLQQLGHTLRRELGGSSGPLLAALLLRCGSVMQSADLVSLESWARALDDGCAAINELGGAIPGDRTMLDALVPFVTAIKHGAAAKKNNCEAVTDALQAGELGVEATAQMKPRLGRSSYLGDRVLGFPDPGAKAILICLRAATDTLFE